MVREIGEMISAGDIGDLLSFSITMPQQTYVKLNDKGRAQSTQPWRLKDIGKIPHVSLDLGVHVLNLIHFLFNRKIEHVVAQQSSHGKFNGVIDFVQGMICLDNKALGSISYGKAFLGQENGLEIKVFGSKGSLCWSQVRSECINFCNEVGTKSQLTFSSPGLKVANAKRYHRFKPGRPTGFMEAFQIIIKIYLIGF